MKPISLDEAKELIAESGGKIFGITFQKRGKKEIRNMLCRLNVKKWVKGIGRTYEFEEKKLIPVFDVEEASTMSDTEKMVEPPYKCIPEEGIQTLRIGGAEYVVKQ